jgi:hypothetical protein
MREAPSHASKSAPSSASVAPAVRESGPQPQKALNLYKEGMIFYAQGNIPDAVQVWEEAVRLDPSLGRAREALRQAQAEMSFR